ncbi:MAG: phospholipid carrier-dependent glycosyltransferase [Candidatus Ryanbacteria bacterium]|nr:phospholipid carrier-dependent glycosyltransferase [Candidatus Ryanbacteria bacterium]
MTEYLMRWDKHELQLFYLAVCIRLLAVVFLVFWYQPFPLAGSDSQSYLSAAQGFVTQGRFVAEGSSTPNSYEMPGYPLFLAILIGIGGLTLVSLFQCVLMGITTALIYRIGKQFSVRVGIIAALLFALDPAGILYSGFILTEPLFIFFFVSAVYMLVSYETMLKGAFAPGLLLGMATLIRPVGEVLALAFLVFYLLRKPVLWKKYIVASLVFALGFAIIVGPWIVRNKILFDRTELSAVAAWQFAYAHAPLFYAYEHGISDDEAIAIFHERLLEVSPYDEDIKANHAGTLSNAPYLWQVAFEYIGEHPVAFARFHIIKTIPFFFSDGLREIAGRVGLISNDLPNTGNLLLHGEVGMLADALIKEPLAFLLFFIGSIFWGVVVLCMLVGAWQYWYLGAHARRVTVVLGCLVIIMAGVAGGAVSHPRYRYSVTPWMFVLAAIGAERLIASGPLTQRIKRFRVLS